MNKTASQISDAILVELEKEALAKQLKSIGSKVKGLFAKKPKEIPMAKIHESPKLKPVPAAVPRVSEQAAQRAKIEAQMQNLRPSLQQRNPFAQQLAEKLQGRLDALGPAGLKLSSASTADWVLAKLAQGYEQMDPRMYEDTPARKRHWPLGAAGALAGGLAGHYLLPSDITKSYRETAKGLEGPAAAAQEAYKPFYSKEDIKFKNVPEEIRALHEVPVRDVSAAGNKVRFSAPAFAAKDYMKSRAWAESMPRTLGGAALGLGGGLLLSSMMS